MCQSSVGGGFGGGGAEGHVALVGLVTRMHTSDWCKV